MQKLVDIRLRNTSQLSGYAKQEDLIYICELLGIQYEHIPALAPTDEILSDYKQDKDWAKYELRFGELMRNRSPLAPLKNDLDNGVRLCLLCSEDKPDQCHRRLVAEYLQSEIPDTAVEHLR